jgi:hypothetical protein
VFVRVCLCLQHHSVCARVVRARTHSCTHARAYIRDNICNAHVRVHVCVCMRSRVRCVWVYAAHNMLSDAVQPVPTNTPTRTTENTSGVRPDRLVSGGECAHHVRTCRVMHIRNRVRWTREYVAIQAWHCSCGRCWRSASSYVRARQDRIAVVGGAGAVRARMSEQGKIALQLWRCWRSASSYVRARQDGAGAVRARMSEQGKTVLAQCELVCPVLARMSEQGKIAPRATSVLSVWAAPLPCG